MVMQRETELKDKKWPDGFIDGPGSLDQIYPGKMKIVKMPEKLTWLSVLT